MTDISVIRDGRCIHTESTVVEPVASSSCTTCPWIEKCALHIAYLHDSLWYPCWCTHDADSGTTMQCWECMRRGKNKTGDAVKRRMMAERLVGDWDSNDVRNALKFLPDFCYAYMHGQIVVCLECLGKLSRADYRQLQAQLLDTLGAMALRRISADVNRQSLYFYEGNDTHMPLEAVRRMLHPLV